MRSEKLPNSPPTNLLNQTLDVSGDFTQFENEYFTANRLLNFNSTTGEGTIQWQRHGLFLDWAFTKIGLKLKKLDGKELPQEDYEIDPGFKFTLTPVSPRTIRLSMSTAKFAQASEPSLMLVDEPKRDRSWLIKKSANQVLYRSEHCRVAVQMNPWAVEIQDASGRLLVKTHHLTDQKALHTKTLPFLFLRRAGDYSRSFAATFTLHHDEKIFGCGESFTRLNKRGQKLPLYTTDAQSAASKDMYKPVPFFMSSRGYGMFVHTPTPCTFDFGHEYDGTTTLYVGDDHLDLFIFIGSPKEILAEYTALTGRSPVPPLWSFGLWMSRLTYKSQKEVMSVARNFRQHKIPVDVIHIDAGWFDHGWRCDYKFSKHRYPNPEKMMTDLKKDGIRIALWQLPYYTPANPIYQEISDKRLFVRDGKGGVPTDDIILDFSNPQTQQWYRDKINELFDLGASAIKADFGECAPLHGLYASGKSGFYEHNIYPLRYTSLLTEITREKSGETIIWARSAWAGSQRYPVHWGGDPEITDYSMAATLRAGLSLGLSGFSFWSHDIGGFSGEPVEELYLRWLFFGMFTSHSRCHGFPPREPWAFSDDFLKDFRTLTELKYSLLPYIYTQAKLGSEQGLPMVRALFLEFPEDPTCWMIEDQYFWGSDILVAPIFEKNASSRNIYLPPGEWIDYQTGILYEGRQWLKIHCDGVPGIMLIKNNTVIPHIQPARSTDFLDWSRLEMRIFADSSDIKKCFLYLPGEENIQQLILEKKHEEWQCSKMTFSRKIDLQITNAVIKSNGF
ncbi:MAG: alpha-xylosidase [Deferribacteres bacterium]|nr:alpha-xylosidase [candidate division KSB1 bacterium]MCB9501660.1 alpha-xylosidase [Deferribacteres bacterium]